jgi:hypothetical protein
VILPPQNTLARFGIGAVVFLVFVLAAEVALQFGLSQKRIEDKINAASGMTVHCEDISVGWLGGVDLKGVTATGVGGDSLSVQSVTVRPDLWAGIRGRLRFEDLRIENIRFVRLEQAKAPELPNRANSDSASVAPAVEKKGALRLREVLGLAKRIRVSNAALDWMKASGSVRAQAEGIEFCYEETEPGKGTGVLNLQRGIWEELLAVDSLHVKIQREDDRLTVPDFSARCGGGKLLGNGSLHLSREAPFVGSLSAANVDLGNMSRELPSVRVAGKAEANFRMEGLLGAQQTWIGDGELTVSDGSFKGLALLQMLGQVFQVQELAQLTARKAHSKIRVAERKAFFEGLEVDAGDIQLRALGDVDFKRAVSLSAQISLAENMIRGKAQQLFGKRFSPADSSGHRTLAFQVTGTLENPKTDLMEKLVGDNLGEIVGGALSGVLDQFLGGLLKSRKNPKPEAKPAPPPDPNPGAEAVGGAHTKTQ